MKMKINHKNLIPKKVINFNNRIHKRIKTYNKNKNKIHIPKAIVTKVHQFFNTFKNSKLNMIRILIFMKKANRL